MEPSDQTGTCELQTLDGRLLDPACLAERIKATRLGSTLRGLEITADGSLRREGKHVVLSIPGCDRPLRLTPLKKRVHWDFKRHKPRKMSSEERSACHRLLQGWDGTIAPIRITGPVERRKAGEAWLLEVRQFDLKPSLLGAGARSEL